MQLHAIMSPYGHEAAGGVRSGRREEELLAGGRASRRDPAGGEPADPVAGGSARDTRTRSLWPPRRTDGGRARPLQEGAAHAPARAAVDGGAGAGGEWRAARDACDRGLDRAGRSPGPTPPVRISAGTPEPRGLARDLRRHRSLEFEPLARDEIVLAVPPEHPFAGSSMPLERLREETHIVMQEGAGVRHVIEEELREAGLRLRELSPKLELGLQESVKSAVAAGYGVTFISRTAIEGELAAGTLGAARVKGLEPARQIYVVRSAGRMPTRAAQVFLEFARARVG